MFNFTKTAIFGLIALTTCANPLLALENEAPFSFALWGDMPYAKNGDNDLNSNNTDKIQALIDDINASDVAFTIYDGDIKDGSSECNDQQYMNAVNRFNTFKKPMIYIPGDNEWTDCHRTNNGGYNGLERLKHLRQVMFASPYSFGVEKALLEHQGPVGGEYAENVRGTMGGVVFVGLNIPGSNNNKVNEGECVSAKSVRTEADCVADNAEYQARDAKNIAFLQDSFQKAKSLNARGLVLVIQADMSFDLPETETLNERTDVAGFDGFNQFLDTLVNETRNFAGEVLLVHGDTHFFKIDKPLIDQAHLIPNFTRIETFGSPDVHWVKVSVSPSERTLFKIEPMLVPGN